MIAILMPTLSWRSCWLHDNYPAPWRHSALFRFTLRISAPLCHSIQYRLVSQKWTLHSYRLQEYMVRNTTLCYVSCSFVRVNFPTSCIVLLHWYWENDNPNASQMTWENIGNFITKITMNSSCDQNKAYFMGYVLLIGAWGKFWTR